MNTNHPIRHRIRSISTKLGSLLLLFQKTPLVQILLPEARVMSTSGAGEIIKWSVATVVGLGAYDSVAGATVLKQVVPLPGSSTVAARSGTPLAFVFQVTGSPGKPKSWKVTGTLPRGLTHTNPGKSSVDSITGTPTQLGTFPITIRAYRNSGFSGDSISKKFKIVVTSVAVGSPQMSYVILPDS